MGIIVSTSNQLKHATFRNDMAVTLHASMGDDFSFVHAARVSTGTDDEADRQDTRRTKGLIDHLIRNHHGSPFEHACMTFRIEAPIAVIRQFQRHRAGWSYNELSGRYAELDGVFYVPTPQNMRTQIGKNADYRMEPMAEPEALNAIETLKTTYNRTYWTYQLLLRDGVARELARFTLPTATYSAMYATCNPRSLMHFLSLRTEHQPGISAFESKPQLEVAMVADQMEAALKELFPLTWEAWHSNGRVAP